MSAIEAYLLYEEKAVALEAAEKMVAEKPGHERWALRRDHLNAEVGDIARWLKEHISPFNDPPPAPVSNELAPASPARQALPDDMGSDRKAATARVRQAIASSQRKE